MLKVSHGDAFSDEIKKETLALIKADLGQVDLIIYNSFQCVSIQLQVFCIAVLKPIGTTFTKNSRLSLG
jgi:enoyl-[acyl-carrier protein] reductase/trans-2-enoyl-CoA reductase (NAD+)